jgi:hypothetical protein
VIRGERQAKPIAQGHDQVMLFEHTDGAQFDRGIADHLQRAQPPAEPLALFVKPHAEAGVGLSQPPGGVQPRHAAPHYRHVDFRCCVAHAESRVGAMRRKPPEPAGDRQARQVAGITQSLQAKKCWSGKALLPGIAFSTVAPARLAFKPGA